MPSSATTRNRLEKQAAGENGNTWGSRFNTNFADMVDEAIDGVTPFTLSGSKTLSTADWTTDESRKRVLNITSGTGGTVTIPNLEKVYLVRNGTTGNVTISTATPTASAVIMPGAMVQVFCDGAASVFGGNKAGAGCLVYRSSNLATQNFTGAGAAVTFNAELRDTHGFWSAGSPTKIIIPAGMSGNARFTGAVQFGAILANEYVRLFIGGHPTITAETTSATDALTGTTFQISTPLLPVTAAEEYQLTCILESDASVTVGGGTPSLTFFSIEYES